MATRTSARSARVRLGQARALVSALSTVALVEGGLRLLTLPRLTRLLGVPLALGPSATHATDDGPDHDPTIDGEAAGSETDNPPVLVLPQAAVRRLAATRRVLRRWPFGDTCLRQALVIGHLLRDLRPNLRVGVAKVDGRVRAHAWIVIDGLIIDPLGAAPDYLSLELPSAGVPSGRAPRC